VPTAGETSITKVRNTLNINKGGIKSDAMGRGTRLFVLTNPIEFIFYSGRVLGVLRRVMRPISASMAVILAGALVFAVKEENRVKDAEI